MGCNKIEVFDRKSGETIITFNSRTLKNLEKQVMKRLDKYNFNYKLQGKITPDGSNLYWLASNEDYKALHLDYRVEPLEKRGICEIYSCFNKYALPVDVVCSNKLVSFENRNQAIEFYQNCLRDSKDERREKYNNVYIKLLEGNERIVTDNDKNTTISSIGKFKNGNIVEIKTLLPAMEYEKYLENQKDNHKEITF